MSVLTIHILDFSLFDVDVDSKALLVDYIGTIDFSLDLVICVGNVFAEAQAALGSAEQYTINASYPDCQVYYFVAFLALAKGIEQSIVLKDPLSDRAIPLSEVSPNASEFLVEFLRRKDEVATSYIYKCSLDSLRTYVSECDNGLIRKILRDFVSFLSSSNELLRIVLDARGSTFLVSKIEIFDIVRSLKNYRVPEEFVKHFAPSFPSEMSQYSIFSKLVRRLSQSYPDLTRIESFPSYFSLLIISFENAAVEFVKARDHSSYLVARMRAAEILMTGKLLDKGLASYNAAGKLKLTSAGIILHERNQTGGNPVRARLLGLSPIMFTLYYRGILSEEQKDAWKELIEFRNSLKETHGFVAYNGTNDTEIDILYGKLRSQCLCGNARNMYLGLSKEIENFTLGKFWRNYFDNEIQVNWA